MKVLKELSIEANNDLIMKLVEVLQSKRFERYVYLADQSILLSTAIGKGPHEILLFQHPLTEEVFASISLLVHNNILTFSDIALNMNQLSIDEYNSIFDNFYETVLKPNLDARYSVVITNDT